MSDGMSDARREAAIIDKFQKGLALLEESFEDGGYDVVFGLNGALVREFNQAMKKYGYRVVERKEKAKKS